MAFTPLFDEDEGFFAEASRQMLASSDYITISVNGEARYDKPALFFWFTAASLKLFGNNEFAARLPSFSFFLINLIILFRFAQKYFTIEIAKTTVVVAITITQFQVLSRAAVSDNLLNLWVSAALFLAYEFCETQRKKDLFWIYTFAGFGFFTKGPIAFLIIYGVIFSYLFFSRKYFLFKKFIHPLFIIWSIFIPLPWFYLAYQASGDFLFTDFLIKHNFGRFTQTMESHGGYIWYYLPVLFISFIPFSNSIYSVFKKENFREINLFLMIWFLLPILFFSFSKTQLPHYISIGYLPLIILISKQVYLSKKAISLQIFCFMLLFIITPLYVSYIKIDDAFVAEMIKNIFTLFDKNYFILMGILLLLITVFYFFSKEKLMLLSIVYLLSANFFIYKFGILQQGFAKEMGLILKHSKSPISMKDHYNPSLSFYAQKVIKIKKTENSNDVFFEKINRKPKSNSKILFQKNGHLLYKIK